MIALIQRVNWSRLSIDQQLHAEIGQGLLALVGLQKSDSLETGKRLMDKVLAYRVFADSEGKMNLSLKDIDGDLLLVSQFTLAASTTKGLRPSFSSAMPPAQAEPLYNDLVAYCQQVHEFVKSGVFAADMQIALENDGPVTFLLEAN